MAVLQKKPLTHVKTAKTEAKTAAIKTRFPDFFTLWENAFYDSSGGKPRIISADIPCGTMWVSKPHCNTSQVIFPPHMRLDKVCLNKSTA